MQTESGIVVTAASPIGDLQTTSFIPTTIASGVHLSLTEDGQFAVLDPGGVVSMQAPFAAITIKQQTMIGRLDLNINGTAYYFRVQDPQTIGGLWQFADYFVKNAQGDSGQTALNENNTISNPIRRWLGLWSFISGGFAFLSGFLALLMLPTDYHDNGYLGSIVFGLFTLGSIYLTVKLRSIRSRMKD